MDPTRITRTDVTFTRYDDATAHVHAGRVVIGSVTDLGGPWVAWNRYGTRLGLHPTRTAAVDAVIRDENAAHAWFARQTSPSNELANRL